MSTDLDNGHVTAWPTNTPQPAETNRRKYIGRHRPGPYVDRNQQPFVAPPVGPSYNPLQPADRAALAPHHWADPDRYLPAPEGERTARMDTAAVLAERQTTPPAGDRGQVLDQMRGELTTPPEILASMERWVAEGCPVDDQTAVPADTREGR